MNCLWLTSQMSLWVIPNNVIEILKGLQMSTCANKLFLLGLLVFKQILMVIENEFCYFASHMFSV